MFGQILGDYRVFRQTDHVADDIRHLTCASKLLIIVTFSVKFKAIDNVIEAHGIMETFFKQNCECGIPDPTSVILTYGFTVVHTSPACVVLCSCLYTVEWDCLHVETWIFAI